MIASLRVAAAQAASVPGDVDANVVTAVSLVEAAADRGARLVVLPELFLTGYAPERWSLDTCVTEDDPRLDPLAEVTAARDVVLVVGAAVRRGSDRATLSLLVVDSSGEVTAPYDKQHLFADERAFFVPGAHGASMLLDGWEVGLGICYDGCFPEHAARAAADGARAYLCPSAYFTGSEHRRDLYYAARALDNGIYVVFAGLAGPCGQQEFSGGSAVYDPEGRVPDRVDDDAPAMVVVDLDPTEASRVQESNPIHRDRLAALGDRRRHRVGGP